MKYIPLSKQVVAQGKLGAAVSSEVIKNAANIDYIAMMCDVDLDIEEDEGQEDE